MSTTELLIVTYDSNVYFYLLKWSLKDVARGEQFVWRAMPGRRVSLFLADISRIDYLNASFDCTAYPVDNTLYAIS